MSERPLRMIATVGAPSGRDDEDACNARLIAAAPELLDALQNLDFHASPFAAGSAGPGQADLLRMSIERSRRALEKAGYL